MTRRITPQTTLENLKKEAKRWLKALRANDAEARERFANGPANPVLRDVQHALAREYGLPGWTDLKQAVTQAAATVSVARYEQLADDMVAVYASGDEAALARINQHYGEVTTAEDIRSIVWGRVYKVRQAGGAASAFGTFEARELIARTAGYGNWTAMTDAIAKGAPPATPAFEIDARAKRIAPRRSVTLSEWESIIGTAREQKIAGIAGNGQMTDEALRGIVELESVISLDLSGSRGLSDDGLQLLARMPQLERLDLNEYPGGKLTDRGLEVLRHLPNLRTFKMTWQKGITDAGAANLRFCEKLEDVDLMGSPTGDGVVEALRGKPFLRRFQTGRLLTDAGIAHLRDYPLFQRWDAATHGSAEYPTELLIDGPFSNQGLASLAGLSGISSLDLFWHVSEISTDAFSVLPQLPNLMSLGCDGRLSDDIAMAHIGAIPRLRKLRAQESAATDDGFIALSRSKSLERFWGRQAPGLTGRGFAALANLPKLRALGVSCKNVDDAALSTLPQFPALDDLTPVDVQDPGFRYVGQCKRLENLSCMYCRETTDAATEQITGLQLKSYYAGLTLITDRSLEILSRMTSLEKVELWQTKSVTDAGIAHLTKLPNLREVGFSGLPLITFAGTRVFPAHVRVGFDA